MTSISKKALDISFRSLYNDFEKTLTFLTVTKIADSIPNEIFPRESLNIPSNIRLADPEFHLPKAVDMLIGADATTSLLSIGQINVSRKDCEIFMQKTQLGWVVVGGAKGTLETKKVTCNLSELTEQIAKFWVIEDNISAKESKLAEESLCEAFYAQTTTRESSGRYIVRLPFRDRDQGFGDSRSSALRRFHALEKNLRSNPILDSDYKRVMNEYINLNHMSLSVDDGEEGYYLPHHAVIKDTSTTTNLRVVFDASAKSNKGLSLNDKLMVGPTIQDKLFEHLLKFRMHAFVLTADIEKMYRQIIIHPDDRKFQRIFWYHEGKIAVFQLNTVTFGVSSAPFLAIRTIKQLADDESANFPLASQIIKRDLYVDDLLTGANYLSEILKIRDDIIALLKRGQFNIRQWASNHDHALDSIDEKVLGSDHAVENNPILKTLGTVWNSRRDKILYSVKPLERPAKSTKRTILSEIAKIFDPLGLLGPILLTAKTIMQVCWKTKIDWDESVPNTLHTTWTSFSDQLPLIREVSVDRRLLLDDPISIQLHGFCDASKVGYGACLYLRSCDSGGRVLVRLACAKSRVAPLKTTTIPRLELCAALTLTRLYQESRSTFNFKLDNIIFWSDSMIVVHWLKKSPQVLKTFEANRVAEIQGIGRDIEWRHINTEQNPADALSRGQLPAEFLKNKLWFKGPSWFQQPEHLWPKTVYLLGDLSLSLVRIFGDDAMLTTINSEEVKLVSRDTLDCVEYLKKRVHKLSDKYEEDNSQTAGIHRIITVKLGAKVILRRNIDVTLGLVNGTIGEIVGFLRAPDSEDINTVQFRLSTGSPEVGQCSLSTAVKGTQVSVLDEEIGQDRFPGKDRRMSSVRVQRCMLKSASNSEDAITVNKGGQSRERICSREGSALEESP
ncbi:uncharacterized protein LOC123988154 [Osmia bicornis bicornis]|uniref:uncharacterized protein LOC123988154 n=1 Tax=Osmia bicornis bicornis TaxID=1437191 RepID=UPI001EAF8967|nr:uncharacterized protein LOC123988154 [Osmia bicornis bicornis]